MRARQPVSLSKFEFLIRGLGADEWLPQTKAAEMRLPILICLACAAALVIVPAARALADDAVVGGSSDVRTGDTSAARQGDATKSGAPVVEGSPNVFINGRPAAVIGQKTGCGGGIVTGSSNVFINGKPMARVGDKITNCSRK